MVRVSGPYIALALLFFAIGLIGGCSLLQSGPVAQFDVQPVVIYAGTTVTFDGSASYAQAAVVSYHWLFGDGEEAYGQQANYSYAEAGIYTVTLKVHDSAGAMAFAKKEIVVYAQSGSVVFQDDFSDGEAALDRWQLDPQWASAGEGTVENLGGAHGYVLHIH
ncbi:MAG: PKD domain-containing protein, partial [Candidatus Bipolaricaulota bacterium]|nr:PKD domain-containing protein [Candidatus Bipolaricaulota bacterium]